jgi:hypothetical protein
LGLVSWISGLVFVGESSIFGKLYSLSVPFGNTLFKEWIEATLGKSVGYIA